LLLINDLKVKFLDEIKNYIINNNQEIDISSNSIEKIFKSIRFEEPKNKEFGDLTTNAAMVLASYLKTKPLDLANDIKNKIFLNWDIINKVEVINPGFINFNIKDNFILKNLVNIFKENEKFGENNSGGLKKIQLEYVSSNPTGNLHIGHGRWGVMGDILSNIYKKNGYDVFREYYVNDYGTQAKLFSECVKSLYLKKFNIDFAYPEEGYPQTTVEPVAEKLFEKFEDGFILNKNPLATDDEAIKKHAINIMLSFIRETLSSIGVEFDNWFLESSLYENNNFEKTIQFLKDNNLIYEKDNALWFKSTKYGDDKDRVIVRSDGNPTYFASDIMYLINKKERGFETLIYILGADHHGYISRLKAIGKSIGMPEDEIIIIIGQLVRILEDKEVLKMSRRKGRGMTLDELIKSVGKDAVRYFFSMNSFDTHMDFDVSLARKKSSKNPVFYVQYAHARIGSIIRKIKEVMPINLSESDIKEIESLNYTFYQKILNDIDEAEFKNKNERNLAWTLLLLPDILYNSCKNNAPYFLTQYLYRLSTEFHYFYNHNLIISKNKINLKRLTLTIAVKIILKNGLEILGISAPDKM